MKKRYYFWQCNSNGWRQLGRADGYKTLKECKKDSAFYIEEAYAYVILKATPCIIKEAKPNE